MRVITRLSAERESGGEEGHDGVNTRAKACRSAVLFLLRRRGGGGREGGRRKWNGGRGEEVV